MYKYSDRYTSRKIDLVSYETYVSTVVVSTVAVSTATCYAAFTRVVGFVTYASSVVVILVVARNVVHDLRNVYERDFEAKWWELKGWMLSKKEIKKEVARDSGRRW